jgi:hypothetical protein
MSRTFEVWSSPRRCLAAARPRAGALGLLLMAACALGACRRIQLEVEPAPPPSPQSAPSSPAPSNPPPASEPPAFPKEGWSELRRRDDLPICLFSSIQERIKAPFLQDAKTQKLPADTQLQFGVYPAGCLNQDCDARPMLQCWVKQEGNTLHVSTRFFAFHKEGSSCTQDCMDVDTSCPTPELKPGKYTVQHGDKSYKLQIPSTLKDPCWNRP